MSDAQELSADEKAHVARFGIHDNGVRVKVWCVNWPHADAPHAVVHVDRNGVLGASTYFPTWSRAIEHAAVLAGVIRRAAAARGGISGRPENSEGLATPFLGVSDAAS